MTWASDAQPSAPCPCCGAEWQPTTGLFAQLLRRYGVRIVHAGKTFTVIGDGPGTARQHDALPGATRDAFRRVVALIGKRLQ